VASTFATLGRYDRAPRAFAFCALTLAHLARCASAILLPVAADIRRFGMPGRGASPAVGRHWLSVDGALEAVGLATTVRRRR